MSGSGSARPAGSAGWEFTDSRGSFRLHNPHHTSHLYFPLLNEAGMMACVTPWLHGDTKTGQHTYLTPPVSVETLHESRAARNFWVCIAGHEPWSASGNSAPQIARRFGAQAESATLEAGIFWHTLTRAHAPTGLVARVTSFVPANDDHVELMDVVLRNDGPATLRLTPTAAIPIFGRSADRVRDHRHVTALLHRARVHPYGVLVRPTLAFDERGHEPNDLTYAVLGWTGAGQPPAGCYADVESFVGEGGTLDWPEAVVTGQPPLPPGASVEGYEALGGLQFPEVSLPPGGSATYRLALAVLSASETPEALRARYGGEDAETWLDRTKAHWNDKLEPAAVQTGDEQFDNWMKWVAAQPIMRRVMGNSFLPYHDYGRGGRGWRDLWQDLLALLLTEPAAVERMLLGNFAGVRLDGSNATIIGRQPGEFAADRNNIPRVWMDHGAWPLLTTRLFIDQTGDLEFLLRDQAYFQDHLLSRAQAVDPDWRPEQGTRLRTAAGEPYRGTVLEHLLVQHLTKMLNAGPHNNLRLEDADWNDGLDMARGRGESVAFTALYAGNLRALADLVRQLAARGHEGVQLAEDVAGLLEPVDMASPAARQARLQAYFERINRGISGAKQTVSTEALASVLSARAEAMLAHLRRQEWIESKTGHAWFNGYYDADGQPVEGDHPAGVRMTLTGQVFPLLAGIATDEQVDQIVRAVNRFLRDPAVGGVRLNTDFREVKHNLGRAFGFAYGHKENGAMFSHMAVMYAAGLYGYGRAREAFGLLDQMYRHSLNFPVSRMYPGLPEYFNARGRGMYPYLTGSASWYLLTLVTQSFGVRGRLGDLLLAPQLVREQFDAEGRAGLCTAFADRRIRVTYSNPARLDAGEYAVDGVTLNGQAVSAAGLGHGALVPRADLTRLSAEREHHLQAVLRPRAGP